mmetsp:Transcript_26647/g.82441  ORF Transcript_26647/g.82441 Transcript_26647/m.82441 type:complete len:212 (-) Transcript_26647:288-923(-)
MSGRADGHGRALHCIVVATEADGDAVPFTSDRFWGTCSPLAGDAAAGDAPNCSWNDGSCCGVTLSPASCGLPKEWAICCSCDRLRCCGDAVRPGCGGWRCCICCCCCCCWCAALRAVCGTVGMRGVTPTYASQIHGWRIAGSGGGRSAGSQRKNRRMKSTNRSSSSRPRKLARERVFGWRTFLRELGTSFGWYPPSRDSKKSPARGDAWIT